MILHSVFWYICLAASLIIYTPKLLIAKRRERTMEPREFDYYINNLASKWALGNVLRSRARFHISGMENIPKDKAVVIVSNHQGDFDIAVFLAYLPVPHGYIAKIEINKVPLLRDWMKLMRCVFIDRSSIRQTAGVMLEAIKTLKNNHTMVLFPEGTRSKSDKMGEFKAASFKLATKAGVPIVPVSISGTYKILEANNGLIKPADVYVKVHPLIRTDNLENPADLVDTVRDIIENGIAAAGV